MSIMVLSEKCSKHYDKKLTDQKVRKFIIINKTNASGQSKLRPFKVLFSPCNHLCDIEINLTLQTNNCPILTSLF